MPDPTQEYYSEISSLYIFYTSHGLVDAHGTFIPAIRIIKEIEAKLVLNTALT